VLIPEAGMKAPFAGSFNEAVQFLHNFRRKNPALVQKNGWSLDIHDIERDVDLYNSQRMVAAGYLNFVDLEDDVPIQKKTSSGLFRSVANAAAKAKTALAIYRDLFGQDGKVVAKEESERRAAVCVKCPQNDVAGGLTKYFLKEAAHEIMAVAGMLKDMDVTTSQDAKLGVCQACECPLVAKLHISNEILKKNIKPDQVAKLDPGCWIPAAIA